MAATASAAPANNMAQLQFLDRGHTYLLDGEELPCVSDLCRFIHREIYQNAPSWQMEQAALRGTAVHLATETLDKWGQADIEEEYLPYLQAYAAFRHDHSVSWDLIEVPMYHPEYRYAGTLDRYGLLDGEKALVDVKTTYTVYRPLCAAQLNLYRLMLIARGYPVQRLYILHLKKDGTYKLISFPMEDALALSLITLHNALQKRRRTRRTKNV